MLVVNGQELNFQDASNVYTKRFNDSMAALKRVSGGSIVLDWTQRHFVEIEGGPSAQKEHATGVTFGMTQNTIVDGKVEHWTYYEDMRQSGERKKYLPRNYTFNDTTGFNGEDANMELLFFLVFISPFCEKCPKIGKFQNPNPANIPADYRLMLPELDAQHEVELGQKIATVQYKIYNDLDVEQIRVIAQSYGLTGTEKMRENGLKVALVKLVCKDLESIEKFLKDSNVNPGVELTATVHLAIEKNFIVKDNRFGRPKWAHKTLDGKIGEEILALSKGETEKQAINALVDYFKNHPVDYDSLKLKVSPPEEVKKKTEVND